MSNPYVGEIRMFGGSFAPQGWLFCDGSVLSISDNDVLFQLIGTTYGGDGQETFAIPDLRGRIPIHVGTGSGGQQYALAQTGGAETVTLTPATIPPHTHTIGGSGSAGVANAPTNATWGTWGDRQYAAAATEGTTLSPDVLQSAGGSQPHDNMPPFLAVSFIISLYGIYPAQS